MSEELIDITEKIFIAVDGVVTANVNSIDFKKELVKWGFPTQEHETSGRISFCMKKSQLMPGSVPEV